MDPYEDSPFSDFAISVDSTPLPNLVAAIEEYRVAWNNNSKPFIWTATVDSIMEKLARCEQTLEKIQCTLPRSRKRKSDNSSPL
jgi:hypothetical protein